MQGCALTIIKLAAFQYYRAHNVRPETAEYLFNRKMGKLAAGMRQSNNNPAPQALLNPVRGVVPVPPSTPHPAPAGADIINTPLPKTPAPASPVSLLKVPGGDVVPTARGIGLGSAVTAPAISTFKKSSTCRRVKLAAALHHLVAKMAK